MGIISTKLNQRVSPSTIKEGAIDNSLSNDHIASTQIVLRNSTIIDKFIVVWASADIHDSDFVYKSYVSRLQQFFTTFYTFESVKNCAEFLSKVKNQSALVVISKEFFPQIASRIKSMSQVYSIYILAPNAKRNVVFKQEYSKVKGIFTRIGTICTHLKRNTRYFQQDSLSMNIIPSKKYSSKDFKEVNQSFIYWILIKEIILGTKYDKQSVQSFAQFCRRQCFSTNIDIKLIDEFEQNYYKFSPIWWYTRDSFIQVMLTRALQSQDIEVIIRMGFFIKDLHEQLQMLQVDAQKTASLPVIAFRSHFISNENFEKIRYSQGNLLSFNNFMMIDPDYDTVLQLARHTNNIDTGVSIVFRMKVESEQTSSPYASLINVSSSPDKGKYILFFLHSIFRIVEIKQIENRVWTIDLTLTEPNDEHLLNLKQILENETQESTGWFKLAQFMSMIRDFDHAIDIYYALLELIPKNEALKMAHVYNKLGSLEDQAGDYMSALAFYQKAIVIRRQNLPVNHPSIGISYNNIGEVQRKMGDYFNALVTHKKSLNIKQKVLDPNNISLATSYNNIALANELLGDFPAALSFYEKALQIKQKSFPSDHQELATTYNNIGELQRVMGHFPAALDSLEKALNIRLQKYSPTDPSLAITYNNIGLIYRELGNFLKAMAYLEKSLEVKLKNFPPNHSSLAFTYNNIGDINHQMGQYSQALISYQKALEIQEKALIPNHPEIAVTYTNIGIAYQSMANYPNAHSFYEKAIQIRKKSFPSNHPLIATSYNNMGHLYQLKGDYTVALKYYEKALSLQERTLSADHPAIGATYNNIADVLRKLENYNKALALYKKSLNIKKKSLTANHPGLATTYNNMGVINQALKNYSAALDCYAQTLAIQQETLPLDHPDLAVLYNNIGAVHQMAQDYSKALDYYRKALEIQEKSLPPNHPHIGATYNSMATAFVALGDLETALRHEQHAIDISSQILSQNHPHLIIFKDHHERIRAQIEFMKKT